MSQNVEMDPKLCTKRREKETFHQKHRRKIIIKNSRVKGERATCFAENIYYEKVEFEGWQETERKDVRM